jgi:hypothetical protein
VHLPPTRERVMHPEVERLTRRPSSSTTRLSRVIIMLALNACHVWRPEPVRSTSSFDVNTRVRVTRNDGTALVLVSTRIANDSIVGVWAGSSTRMALPVTDIRRLDTYGVSADRTTAVVVGVAVATLVFIVAFRKATQPKPFDPCPGRESCFE